MGKVVPIAAGITDTTTQLTYIWRIVRQDNVTQYFTSHTSDVPFGGNTYLAALGFSGSSIKETEDNAVNTQDVMGLINSPTIERDDLIRGLYDNAKIFVSIVNYTDPDNSEVKVTAGFLGRVRIQRGMFVAEWRDLKESLQQNVGEQTTPTCRANLGDDRCKVRTDPPIWVASTVYAQRESFDAGQVGVLNTVQAIAQDQFMHFEVQTPGTSGVSEPTWPTVAGQTVVDNGVTWIARQAKSYRGSISTSNAHAWWRINGSNASSGVLQCREIQFRFSSGGPDLLDLIGIAEFHDDSNRTTQQQDSSHAEAVQAVFDNDTDSYAFLSAGGGPHIARWGVRFNTPVAVGFYTVGKPQGVLSNNRAFDDWTLESSDDGSVWNVEATETNQQATINAGPDNFGAEFTGISNPVSVPTTRVFVDTNLANFPDSWFKNGLVEFTSGQNNGLKMEVKDNLSGQVELFDDLPFAPAASDTFIITTGCRKRIITDCRTKFDNTFNFRGEANIPGIDKITSTPNVNR